MSASGSLGTLDSLAVYLTLQKARELHGFRQEDFGLSDAEAAAIARLFSAYDTNDDYRLDAGELERLFSDAGRALSKEEAQAAMSAIDLDQSGYIDFTEFVRFWQNPAAATAAVPAADVPATATSPAKAS